MGEFDDLDDDPSEGGTKIAQRSTRSTSTLRDRAYLIVLAGNNVGEMYKVDELTYIGRSHDAQIRVLDDGVSRKHARISLESGQIVVEDFGSTNGTFVNGERIRKHALQDGDKIEVGSTTILKFTFHDRLDEQFQQQMFDAALRDGLTRIFNKRYLDTRLQTEIAFSLRHGSPLSLLMLDIDHFKKVNDNYGHPGGDFVLTSVSQLIQQTIRKEDVFARYGGEEFALLSRGIDLDGAEIFAERIRTAIEKSQFEFSDAKISITVSIGVAGMPDPQIQEGAQLLKLADEALYEAKNQGRNRTIVRRP